MTDQITAITAHNVVKHYASPDNPVVALKHVHVEIRDRFIQVLVCDDWNADSP